ncbi:MAG: DNA mismatch repair protein MutH [Gammaproteobacteria bacterium]
MTTLSSTKAPKTESELLESASGMTGKSLLQIAGDLGLQVPDNQKKAKGWTGELIELFLGATASSLPEPDFQYIGVELKTLPLDEHQKPKESTYVCTVPLSGNVGSTWEDSIVKLKLNRVLWVPIEAQATIPLSQRRIGQSFIWSPNPQQEHALRTDWQELMDMVSMGELDKISARQGKYLQIRPKAANARALSRTTTETGEPGVSLPRGFYLRPLFTKMLINNQSP